VVFEAPHIKAPSKGCLWMNEENLEGAQDEASQHSAQRQTSFFNSNNQRETPSKSWRT